MPMTRLVRKSIVQTCCSKSETGTTTECSSLHSISVDTFLIRCSCRVRTSLQLLPSVIHLSEMESMSKLRSVPDLLKAQHWAIHVLMWPDEELGWRNSPKLKGESAILNISWRWCFENSFDLTQHAIWKESTNGVSRSSVESR